MLDIQLISHRYLCIGVIPHIQPTIRVEEHLAAEIAPPLELLVRTADAISPSRVTGSSRFRAGTRYLTDS